MNGDPLALDYGNTDWISGGANVPPPSAQPAFNSPVTTDSFSILDTISTGVGSLGSTLSNIIGAASNVQTAAAAGTASNQAAALRAQSQSTTQQVQRAQSTAQIQAAQANANIASAFAKFTGSPLVWALVLALIGYFVLKRV